MAFRRFGYCVILFSWLLAIVVYATVHRYTIVLLPNEPHAETDRGLPVARLDNWSGEVCIRYDSRYAAAPTPHTDPSATICWKPKSGLEMWTDNAPLMHRNDFNQ